MIIRPTGELVFGEDAEKRHIDYAVTGAMADVFEDEEYQDLLVEAIHGLAPYVEKELVQDEAFMSGEEYDGLVTTARQAEIELLRHQYPESSEGSIRMLARLSCKLTLPKKYGVAVVAGAGLRMEQLSFWQAELAAARVNGPDAFLMLIDSAEEVERRLQLEALRQKMSYTSAEAEQATRIHYAEDEIEAAHTVIQAAGQVIGFALTSHN